MSRTSDPELLLGPRIRQGLEEPGDGEIGRRGSLGNPCNDAGGNEGESCQRSDVPFALAFSKLAAILSGQPDPLLLLAPGIGQRLEQAGDGEVGGRGAIHNGRHDAG